MSNFDYGVSLKDFFDVCSHTSFDWYEIWDSTDYLENRSSTFGSSPLCEGSKGEIYYSIKYDLRNKQVCKIYIKEYRYSIFSRWKKKLIILLSSDNETMDAIQYVEKFLELSYLSEQRKYDEFQSRYISTGDDNYKKLMLDSKGFLEKIDNYRHKDNEVSLQTEMKALEKEKSSFYTLKLEFLQIATSLFSSVSDTPETSLLKEQLCTLMDKLLNECNKY